MPNFELISASEADKEFIRNLNQACYENVVRKQFGKWKLDEQHQYFENKWNPDKYQLIIEKADLVGILSVQTESDHIFLAEILIVPSFQNNSLGSTVIRSVLENAKSLALPVRLQVLLLNPAINLYLRLGFSITGETSTHRLMEYVNTQ